MMCISNQNPSKRHKIKIRQLIEGSVFHKTALHYRQNTNLSHSKDLLRTAMAHIVKAVIHLCVFKLRKPNVREYGQCAVGKGNGNDKPKELY